MAAEEPVPHFDGAPLSRRARRRAARTVVVGAVGAAAAIAAVFTGVAAIRTAPIPAIQPTPTSTPTAELGIFEPVAGHIVYYANSSLWAVDPNAPSPVSTLVRLDFGGTADADRRFASFTVPLGWSSDGTQLLLVREDPADQTFPNDRYLYILHADGTETQVTFEPVGGAAISPDGSRVVFAADGGGLYVVDAVGGQPVRIADEGESPTFSPDGTQIAYLSESGQAGREHVWVANADGTDAHEILTDETLDIGMSKLTWSPSGDRIAMENQQEGHVAIYTFAPDGSDFTMVITGGFNHSWSPDGTQIAYGVPGRDGLSIADADGSHARTLGFGSPGPWHPATLGAPTKSGIVNGWPGTGRNQAGVYSWDGSRCASASCNIGFMHNGYGSGDVQIGLNLVPDGAISDDATAVTVAGRDGFYRRIDAEREEWSVDIDGTTVFINLEAQPGTSQADLADARAIIRSLRLEPADNYVGFRLVFTLTNAEWDSG
jgi:hypothetical protein